MASTWRGETKRRRVAYGPSTKTEGRWYLIRSECSENGWQEGRGLTHWEGREVRDRETARELAIKWLAGSPKGESDEV